MDSLKQIDCFNIHIKISRILGLWPTDSGKYYRYYALIFVFLFVVIFNLSYTINFIFLPRILEIFVENIILYSNIVATVSKIMTFYFSHDKIIEIFSYLESDTFNSDSIEAKTFIVNAKKMNIKLWKIVTTVSLIAHLNHVYLPVLVHLITGDDLHFPVYSCDFMPKDLVKKYIYPIYIYQSIAMTCHMWCNINLYCFILGFIVFITAQLDILDFKLRTVTTSINDDEEGEQEALHNLNNCVIHYDEVAKFCNLVQDVFSVTLFLHFITASLVLCVCLFRLMLPAPTAYCLFIVAYMLVMLFLRAALCWFGNKVIEKSSLLSFSAYNCNWTPRSRRFKSNFRLFVERANRPLCVTGGKMVVLSLETFTAIIKSSYSFYTLLRHMMQSHDM